MKKIVVLTGAGISAESGIKTFRDSGGLWEEHDVMDVASIEGWHRNKELVLNFYNERRQQLATVVPNAAHKALAALETAYEVLIVTQNVDDLHERGGSSNIIHLHGELKKVRSVVHEQLVYDCEKDIHLGDTCERGTQLRPHIVWFGEAVPLLEKAAIAVAEADIILVVGTSMQVYPAAGLVGYAAPFCPVYYIDPYPTVNHELARRKNLTIIEEKATVGVPKLLEEMMV